MATGGSNGQRCLLLGRWRLTPSLLVLVTIGLLASSCGSIERRELRITPTATAEVGVRVIADNCPGPSNLTLSIRDEVIWEIESPSADESSTDDAETEAELETESTEGSVALREFIVGETPDGWQTSTPLETQLQSGIRYTLTTRPDFQSIDFSTVDLRPGLLFDGVGNRQFNDDLIAAECSEPADLGLFVNNLAVLAALWVTAAALVLVALISLLFVITRRFGRIQSIERQGG